MYTKEEKVMKGGKLNPYTRSPLVRWTFIDAIYRLLVATVTVPIKAAITPSTRPVMEAEWLPEAAALDPQETSSAHSLLQIY